MVWARTSQTLEAGQRCKMLDTLFPNTSTQSPASPLPHLPGSRCVGRGLLSWEEAGWNIEWGGIGREPAAGAGRRQCVLREGENRGQRDWAVARRLQPNRKAC